MHSYLQEVPAFEIVDAERNRRPFRKALAAACLTLLACTAIIVAVGDSGDLNNRTVLKPKFVDWKKEDAGSDDMNLHLQVADALAKADGMEHCSHALTFLPFLKTHSSPLALRRTGLAEKAPQPVPEDLLKEAQQAAEEQKSMPNVSGDEKLQKLHLPAGLEKMFQQAKDEQEVEKLAKEGDHKVRVVKEGDASGRHHDGHLGC